MADKHIIEHTVFDIAFGSEDEAFAQQADLGAFVKNRLLRVVDEVFTAMSAADQIHRIDALEIDLGTVAYHGFGEEMERRLRDRLTTVLQDKLASLPAVRTPYATEGVMTRPHLEREQLAYFLLSGRLPWHAHLERDQTLEQLLQRVMQSTGSEFKAWLQRLARRDTVIPRLVSQFPDDLLRDLIGVLEPGGEAFISAVIERPALFQQAVQEPGHGAETLKGQVWAFTFSYLLVERGSRFNQRDFMGSLVRQLAAHHNLRYDDLLHAMTAVLESSEASHPLRRDLLQLLGELAGERGGREQAVGERQERATARTGMPQDPDLEWVRALLAAALPYGAAAGLADVWDMLVHEQPQLLEALLRYYGRQSDVRRRLAIGFPAAMLKDIVGLLEPGGRAFIEAVLERPALFQHAVQEPRRGVGGLQVQLWEFTFTYVLVERGSHFNQRAYMGSLVHQMAAHHNLRYGDLLRSMTAVLNSSEASHPLRRELLQLLGELTEESDDRPSAAEAVDTRSPDLPQAYDLYGIYREHQPHPQRDAAPEPPVDLAWTQAVLRLSDRDLERLIHVFLARQPARLRSFVASALTGRETAARFIDRLPEWLLSRLLLLLAGAPAWLLQDADLIATVCHHSAITTAPGRMRRLKWQYLFRYGFEAGRSFDAARFVRRFTGYLAEQLHWPDATAFRTFLSQQLALNIRPSTRERHRALIHAMAPNAEPEPQPGTEPEAPTAEPVELVHTLGEEAPDLTEDIYIANAGQVLAAPYLPRLFDMLELTENAAFKDQAAAERAVHLLQFMVNGQTDAPEYQLVLNKLLCGVRTGKPIDRAIDITDRERETIEGLIQGIIQNWKVIGNTSVAGLRESFLQREGRLQLQDDAWHLLVQPRAFDMLLNQLPWSFAVIKHPWMERVVYVEWR